MSLEIAQEILTILEAKVPKRATREHIREAAFVGPCGDFRAKDAKLDEDVASPTSRRDERLAAENIGVRPECGVPGHALDWEFEIHADIGENGPTKSMIQEIVGMIRAHNFEAKTKPESCAASNVADRYV